MESLLHYVYGNFPGILYHGSTVELKEGDYLEPFESKLLNGDKAVFATNNIVCAMALAHKKMPESYVFNDHIELGFKRNEFYIVNKDDKSLKSLYEDTKAFIYSVDANAFQTDSRLGMQHHEFISKERVRIEKVIPVANLWNSLVFLASHKSTNIWSEFYTLEFKSQKHAELHLSDSNNNDNNNVSGTAKRFDIGKPRFSLIPPAPLEEIAKVLTMGAEKYGDRNWEKGMKWTRCVDSLERHLNAWKSGENLDKESGLPHLAHVCVNSMFLLQYEKTYPQGDDRK